MTFETEVDVRFSDLDTYGHVNNAVFATYLEEARIEYLDEVIGREEELLSGGVGRTGMVVANLELDFRRPVRSIGSVTVAVEITDLGRSSFTIEYEVREDDVAATGETTMVAYDRDAGESRPLPDEWRDAIVEFEDLDGA
ncbi:acyl-CoA thioesterase [Halomicrobium salinisoli]|uniref:acyl-CoA thioesterase n=1 Tax=Halomicrobium salinisoli TaxID=2878391 RepID=UPI001CEFDECD|nr:thioesterase family protein [Halomicrobium salinisoli]